MAYSHGDVQATPYCGSVKQSDKERHRLLSVGVAASFPLAQVRVRDGDVNERSSRELTRRGRLSSSTRPFRHRGLA
jgi:hypothetical protein